jgi:photosystem II stability/assembly factor-like uncharacterized protein
MRLQESEKTNARSCSLVQRVDGQGNLPNPHIPASSRPANLYRIAVCSAVLVLALPVASLAGVSTWTTQGPGGGLLGGLTVDPSSPATLYASTEIGVFKSANGGSSWTPSSTGLTGLSVRCTAVDPQTPTTVYAGASTGVFKSVDAGASWSPASTGLPITNSFDLAIDPQTPTTLYIAVNPGNSHTGPAVFKSTNGSGSWVEIDNGFNAMRFIVSLAVDPDTPTTLYAADFLGAIFKSTNAGASWVAVLPSALNSIYNIAVDPQTPTTIYAAMGLPQFIGGVYKSVNGGASWTLTSIASSSNAVYALAVDPTTSSIVYAATDMGVYRSTNGGGTWSPMNTGLMNFDVLALRIDPQTPTTLYAANGLGGAFKSANSGASWTTINAGLPGANVAAVAVDPQTPTTLYAATSADGVQKSSDRGASWAAANVGLSPNTSMTALAIDPQSSGTVYAGGSTGVFKSLDSGGTWSSTGVGPLDIRSFAVDPQTSAIVYAGTFTGGLFKSSDGGNSWSTANNGLSMFMVSAIVFDPAPPTTLYAGGTNLLVGAGVFISTDAGASWSALNNGLANLFVTALVADAQQPATLYAGTLGGGVFKLANGIPPWIAISNGLTDMTVTSLAVDPDGSTLYAGTYAGGVFKSTDGGGTWSPINAGLSQLAVSSLVLDKQVPTTVYAGISGEGGGVFDLEQPVCGNGFAELSEQCDDGPNNGTAGSCCTPTCTLNTDGDGDGVCDALDPCPNIDHGQDFLPKTKIRLVNINADTTPGNDKLLLTGSFALPSGHSFADLDPLTDGARVILTKHDGTVVCDAALASGAYGGAGTRGWTLNGSGTAWTFADRTGAPAYGITDLKVVDQSSKAPGRVRVRVKGKNATYAVHAGDIPVSATVVFGDQAAAETGYCGQTVFAADQCALNAAGTKLKCAR